MVVDHLVRSGFLHGISVGQNVERGEHIRAEQILLLLLLQASIPGVGVGEEQVDGSGEAVVVTEIKRYIRAHTSTMGIDEPS